MFGWRGLYNFGWQDRGREVEELERGMAVARGTSERGVESGGQAVRVEEVQDPAIAGQAAGQNQKGRFSAGAEVYFSAKQRSFGSMSVFLHRLVVGSSDHACSLADDS